LGSRLVSAFSHIPYYTNKFHAKWAGHIRANFLDPLTFEFYVGFSGFSAGTGYLPHESIKGKCKLNRDKNQAELSWEETFGEGGSWKGEGGKRRAEG
jgi:hypothetical protein